MGVEGKGFPVSMVTALVIAESIQDQQDYLGALSRTGQYLVITATNVETGLEYIREHRVDVVVMNFQQPRVEGMDLVEVLRQCAVHQPFIVMLVREEQMVEAVKALHVGADEFLLKDREKRYLQYLPNVIAGRIAQQWPTATA